MNTVILIGSAHQEMSNTDIDKCLELGRFFARNNIKLVTGACSGVPYYVGKGSVELGGSVIGYSPAVDINEHLEVFDFPTDGCSQILYIDGTYEKNNAFLVRSMEMMEESKFVVSLFGNWGTLNELVFSVFSGKKIFCASFMGGISGIFSTLYKELNTGSYDYGAELVSIDSYSELELQLKRTLPNYV